MDPQHDTEIGIPGNVSFSPLILGRLLKAKSVSFVGVKNSLVLIMPGFLFLSKECKKFQLHAPYLYTHFVQRTGPGLWIRAHFVQRTVPGLWIRADFVQRTSPVLLIRAHFVQRTGCVSGCIFFNSHGFILLSNIIIKIVLKETQKKILR